MLYVPPSFSTDANASYVGKNVAAGKQGSKVPPGALEYPQREIMAVQAAAGLAGTNTDLTQLLQAINILIAAKSAVALSASVIVGGRLLLAKYAAGTYQWKCPAGVTQVRIRAVGAGAGGGGGNGYAGAGGLGGNFFEGVFDVVPGTTYTIVIGAGGIAGGGGGGGNPGGNGGSTYIQLTANTPVALGGTGGGSGGNAATGYVGIAGNTPGYAGIVFPYGGIERLGYGAQNGIYFNQNGVILAEGGEGGGAPYFAVPTHFPVQNGQFAGSGSGGGGSGGAGASLGGPGTDGAMEIWG